MRNKMLNPREEYGIWDETAPRLFWDLPALEFRHAPLVCTGRQTASIYADGGNPHLHSAVTSPAVDQLSPWIHNAYIRALTSRGISDDLRARFGTSFNQIMVKTFVGAAKG